MSDVFPQPNVSDLSMPWARAHDNRVLDVEKSLESLQQSVAGQNRNTASSLQEISRILQGLQDAVNMTPFSQMITARNTSFAPQADLADPEWTLVAERSFSGPRGMTRMGLSVNGSARVFAPTAMNVTNVQAKLILRAQTGEYQFESASMRAPKTVTPVGDYFYLAPLLGEVFLNPEPLGYTLSLVVASNGGPIPEDPQNFGQFVANAVYTRF